MHSCRKILPRSPGELWCQKRSVGARKDNQTLCDFGGNHNTIPNQTIFGRVTGRNAVSDNSYKKVDMEPLPCRKKIKTQ